MNYSVVLKRMRIEKGITQSVLARKLKTSNSVISMIERNKQEITIDFLERYAQFFDTTALAIMKECYTMQGKKFLLEEEQNTYQVYSKSDMNILMLLKQTPLYEKMVKNPQNTITLMNCVVIATEEYIKNRY